MRSLAIVFVVMTAIGFGGHAFAADDGPQPLTRTACDAAGMSWNDGANVCGATVMAADDMAADDMAADDMATDDMAADDTSQPLTRAACEAAGMDWNDGANACGVETPAQPLTRADCDAAGMSWNDSANACGVAAAAAVAAAPAKAMMEPGEKKVVKKVTTRHGTKKTVKRKTAHGTTVKKQKRPFMDWLKSTRNQ
jgi:hypothetical protein